MRPRRFFALALLAATAPGPSHDGSRRSDEPEVAETPSSGVYRHDVPREAYAAFAGRPEFAAVGAFTRGDGPSGSGTLVAADRVLTAAHVARLFTEEGRDDERFVLADGTTRAVSQVRLHPEANGSFQQIDLALVGLDAPVEGVTPVTVSTEPVPLGTEVALIGWGLGGPADGSASGFQFPGGRMGGMNVIDSIGPPVSPANGGGLYPRSTLIADFDGIGFSELNRLGSPDLLPLEFTTYKGDSGGAVFREVDGSWVLVAVVSTGDWPENAELAYGALTKAVSLEAGKEWLDAFRRTTAGRSR